jgi:predicted nucleotidyltransferase/fido (protein-threonine AMPylation protein)
MRRWARFGVRPREQWSAIVASWIEIDDQAKKASSALEEPLAEECRRQCRLVTEAEDAESALQTIMGGTVRCGRLDRRMRGGKLALTGTPYGLSVASETVLLARLDRIREREGLLRSQGFLSTGAVRAFCEATRFEQVAESNALEGSTLSVEDTEQAVLCASTFTGHDPGFVRDAIALDRALRRMVELATETNAPTDIAQIHEIHALLLGDRPGAGLFRKERVLIRGSRHTPPKTWEAVMRQMETLQAWSREHAGLPAPLRSMVLHAWLTHVHPYIDGNGRLGRAMGNLELIRGGYPPIIIRKQRDRPRYIAALGESDAGGIGAFAGMILERVDSSLFELKWRAQDGASSRRSPPLDPATVATARAFLARVQERFPVLAAILFGSRARGDHRSDSDADLAVILAGGRGRFLEAKLEMADIAFDVLLETGLRVQPLPIWEDEWDHPDAYSNPALLRNIEREGVLL